MSGKSRRSRIWWRTVALSNTLGTPCTRARLTECSASQKNSTTNGLCCRETGTHCLFFSNEKRAVTSKPGPKSSKVKQEEKNGLLDDSEYPRVETNVVDGQKFRVT